MMSNLRELIPGSEAWPRFVRNQSDRFEARFSLVEVTKARLCCCREWWVRRCQSRFRTAKVRLKCVMRRTWLSLKAKDW